MVILGYAFGLLVVAAVVFAVAAVIFGRGESTPPLETGSTPTVLPESQVQGTDVRALRFQQVVRGYKQAEVDWALGRLANEIDDLRAVLAAVVDSDPGVVDSDTGAVDSDTDAGQADVGDAGPDRDAGAVGVGPDGPDEQHR